jgi:hypothetical protein
VKFAMWRVSARHIESVLFGNSLPSVTQFLDFIFLNARHILRVCWAYVNYHE